MHCAICREIGHNRSKCPTRHPKNDEESEITRVEQGEPQNEEVPKTQNEGQKIQNSKTAKELRRQKIPIRRKGPSAGVPNEEVPNQEVPNQNDGNEREKDAIAEQNDEVPDLEKYASSGDDEREPLISNDRGKFVDELAFLKNFPRKKMPLIVGQTEDWQ